MTTRYTSPSCSYDHPRSILLEVPIIIISQRHNQVVRPLFLMLNHSAGNLLDLAYPLRGSVPIFEFETMRDFLFLLKHFEKL